MVNWFLAILAVLQMPKLFIRLFLRKKLRKRKTPEGTEVVEKAENPLPESPSEDTIKYGGENTVNHTDQSVNSLMSQIKQVFRNLTDLLISLLGNFSNRLFSKSRNKRIYQI